MNDLVVSYVGMCLVVGLMLFENDRVKLKHKTPTESVKSNLLQTLALSSICHKSNGTF